MKKEVLIIVSTILLLAIANPITAQDFIENGRQCLNNQIDEKSCSSLSLEENIYSTLATGKCTSELKSKASKNCWGSPSCNTEKTAKAIVALKSQDKNTTKYEKWLENQSQTEKNLQWLLQIDSPESTCTINSGNDKYKVKINEKDKLTETDAHQCFSISDSEYRISIDNDCYSQDFSVSCNKSFSTTTFFKERDSQIVHILQSTEESSPEENQTKSIKSKCIGKGASCSYEGTLWSSLALSLGTSDKQSKYMPYLIGFKESNQPTLPESILYYVTANENYLSELMSKQVEEGYWFESGDRYYDTALALFSFGSESNSAKESAINWTRENQGSDGCWNDKNIADTAFLVHAIDPQTGPSTDESKKNKDEETKDCEGNGYCMKESACESAGGEVQTQYSCNGFEKCCSEQKEQESCKDIGGNICSSGEACSGTQREDISTSTGFCCDGTCEEPKEEKKEYWELQNGTCASTMVLPSEAGSSLYDSQQACESNISTEKDESSFLEDNLILVIVLVILAILTILGIMYRKKIIDKVNQMLGKKHSSKGQSPTRKQPSRKRVVKKQAPRKGPPQRKRPSRKGGGAGDDEVFNKLKEMGGK